MSAYSEALTLRDEGRYPQAEAAVRAALAAQPRDLEALALLAQLQLMQRRPADAAETHKAMTAIDPGAAPSQRTLARLLIGGGRGVEAVAAARAARAADSAEANTLVLSSVLAATGELDEARALAQEVLARNPSSAAANAALAQVAVQRGEPAEAVRRCEAALALQPGLPLWSLLASLRRRLGDGAGAAAAYRRALEANPDDLRSLIDLAEWELRLGRLAEAEALARRAVALAPQNREAVTQLVVVLLESDRPAAAQEVLEDVAARDTTAAWALVEIGRIVWRRDRAGAEGFFRRAVELAPRDPEVAIAYAQILTSPGRSDEGADLERAVELVLGIDAPAPESGMQVAATVLWNTGHFAESEAIGPFAELSRHCARQGRPAGLQNQLPKVRGDADRLELLQAHRLWGEIVERAPSQRPIVRPPRRSPDGKVRLGLLSSDLRNHVVAHFAQPLFQHRDPRFELYAYSSYPGPADEAQAWIARRVTAFRDLPSNDREAAQLIAADDLDMLLELGGPTHMNRPGVVAYRPARLQGSWLGYPHSLGLQALDYFVADPYLAPPRRELLLEEPLLMPSSWICMAPAAYPDTPLPEPVAPVRRSGRITFGTANNTYKFNPLLLRTWARVVASVPGSRFMIIRPEAGAASFRRNIERCFAEQGVAADRIVYRAQRGQIRPLYGEMDIALDTFPLTGGTTTCDALWMGVPTVSLVGDAVYERLSYSILSNAGLAELCATSVDDFVRTAVDLAAAPERLEALRLDVRERIRSRPLGQPERFAADFYDLIARTVAERHEG